jgi:hypothetical protein
VHEDSFPHRRPPVPYQRSLRHRCIRAPGTGVNGTTINCWGNRPDRFVHGRLAQAQSKHIRHEECIARWAQAPPASPIGVTKRESEVFGVALCRWCWLTRTSLAHEGFRMPAGLVTSKPPLLTFTTGGRSRIRANIIVCLSFFHVFLGVFRVRFSIVTQNLRLIELLSGDATGNAGIALSPHRHHQRCQAGF